MCPLALERLSSQLKFRISEELLCTVKVEVSVTQYTKSNEKDIKGGYTNLCASGKRSRIDCVSLLLD